MFGLYKHAAFIAQVYKLWSAKQKDDSSND
jgi:hypothetical protein